MNNNKKKDIFIFEFQSKEFEHVSVNSEVIRQATERYNVHLFATPEHFNAIKAISNNQLMHHSIILPQSISSKIVTPFRLFLDLPPHSRILILSCSTLSILTLILFALRRRIYLIHHGLLSNLVSKNVFKRNFYKLIFLILNHSNIVNICLGFHIKRLKVISNFIRVEVPYVLGKIKNINNIKDISESVKIGTIGIQSKGKGSADVLKIQNKLKNFGLNVFVIGTTNNILLSNDLFIYNVNELDIVFFAYPVESYQMISSGAYYEVALRGKQIVAYKLNPFFEYHAKINKNIHLVENADQMIMTILNLSKTFSNSNDNNQILQNIYKSNIGEVL